MVCGLFSSFDPSVSLLFSLENFSFKWLMSLMMIFCFFSWRVFFVSTGIEIFKKEMLTFVNSVIFQSMKGGKGVSAILFSTFFLFFFSNLLGLIPFCFTLSSHLVVNLSISLIMWLSGVMVMLKKSSDFFLSHMVPLGSPLPLWPLLVIVESVSTLIRPFTLAIRLMANVMAGHLIMSLIGGFSVKVSVMIFPFPVLVEFGFLSFEACVAIVQAYVFKSLLVMYWAESSH